MTVSSSMLFARIEYASPKGFMLSIRSMSNSRTSIAYLRTPSISAVFAVSCSESNCAMCATAVAFWVRFMRAFAPANIRLFGIITALAIVHTRLWTAVFSLGHKVEPWGQNLLHQQAGRDGLQRIVHRFRNGLTGRIRFRDQVGEAGMEFVWRIPSGSADDLHDLGQAGPVAYCEGMFAPNPVEPFLRHTKSDNDIDMVPDVLLCRVFQCIEHFGPAGHVGVIHQISNPQHSAIGRLHKLKTRRIVDPLPLTKGVDDMLDFLVLVLGAFAGVDRRDV